MKIANLKIGTSILNIKSDFNRSYLSLNKTGYEIVFIIIFNIGVLTSSTSGIVLRYRPYSLLNKTDLMQYVNIYVYPLKMIY